VNRKLSALTLLTPLLFALPIYAGNLSNQATKTAAYAVKTYQNDMVDSLAKLVKHNTVAIDGIPSTNNPTHIKFKQELKAQAEALGLDYKDDGYVVIIGLGDATERIGIITHGDIQPVTIEKWKSSPFELDLTSEPGKLIGRGTEDDKGPISTALYAMKAIKDQKIKLNKRIELYIYMAEESDWGPLEEYVKTHKLPETNITIDAEYPVVTAEKGYGTISLTFTKRTIKTKTPYLAAFTGGFFGSQIPEDATATIKNGSVELLQQLMAKAKTYTGINFDLTLTDKTLTIKALGKSAHSSKPEDGVNAITHLAELLSIKQWPMNTSGALVNFINDQIGTGLYGKKFGDIAFSDDFMGPMTVAPTVIKQLPNGIQLNINIRRPRGKKSELLATQIKQAVKQWEIQNNFVLSEVKHSVREPWIQKDAPHVNTLLSVFSHYTGVKNAKPVAIGGGTNSRLFPNAVSFGPSMPNTEYTGHSEHEFITMKQFVLNLNMYTAALVELAQ
jgi:dipeptidase D